MLNSKKIVALIVVLLLVVGILTMQVKASDTIINFDELLNQTNSTNTLPTDEPANEVGTNTTGTNQESTGSIVQPQTNKTANTESGNNLPQTGVTEDITVMFFIVVCVILAIYAYKKIRDYK